jgi:hypothetical protein
MNPLQSRKRLLLAESELNRAHLSDEWQQMTQGVHSITERAKTFRSIALAAASLAAGLSFLRRSKPAPAAQKSSWWRSLLQGAQLAGSLWTQFGGRPKS